MASSKGVVIAALIANGAIAILKFFGFLLTGSPAMLSEAYHSVSDTGNQVFLLIGIRYSGRDRNRQHPFGYGKAQFFYSFLVSVLLFGIAGWESAKHGWEAVNEALHGGAGHGAERADVVFAGVNFTDLVAVDPFWVNVAVLLGGIVFESYAFAKAYKAMKREILEEQWSGFVEAFRKTANITTLTALTEDTIALVGLALALAGIVLSRLLGNPLYDAVAALVIGVMLMGFALALAWENKRLLLGESLPASDERELRSIVAGWEGVTDIVDFRTVYFGPEEVLVAADVGFDPSLETEDIDEHITAIEDALMEARSSVRKVYIEPET